MSKDKKQFLKSYLLQQSKIDRLNEMIDINPKKKDLYLQQIAECEAVRSEIEEKISLIDDELLKELLIQKYIFGKTLEEIGLILNYSKRHAERLHIRALKNLKI
ncbi:MAG: hypothetical protein IKK55_02160 [Clostridia bacterium]|nr:hypothetical protein [Clostridia bacterium]